MGKFLFRLFSILFPFTLFAAPPQIVITGPTLVIEGATYNYTATLTDPGLSASWSAANGTTSNASVSGQVYNVSVTWAVSPVSQPDEHGRLILHLSNGEDVRLNVRKLNYTAFYQTCLQATPLTQGAVYGQPPQAIAASACVAVPNEYYVTYQWEYMELPGNLNVYATTDNTTPPVTPNQPWVVWNGATGSQVTPMTLYAAGSVLYRCRASLYRSSNNAFIRSLYTGICQVTLGHFDAGEIWHNTAYPINTHSPDNAIYVGYNQQILPISQQPATGGLCGSKAYSWECSYDNGPWFSIAVTEALPGNLHPSMIHNQLAIRRKVECNNVVLYSNTLYYQLQYSSPWAENRNYLRVNEIRRPGIQTWPQADNLPIGEKLQTTTYYDGLNQTIQQVEKEVSYNASNNTWGDFVTHVQYDGAGRADKDYLPYPSASTIGLFKTNAATEQPAFIRNYYGENSDAPTWNKVAFENDPISKPINVKEAGSWWGGNNGYTGISVTEKFNEAGENVRMWEVDGAPGSIPFSPLYYEPGRLRKNWVNDEKQQKVLEYTDFDGKVILKKVQIAASPGADETGWLCTYYVYDAFGRLRYVIPPKAVEWMMANGWSFTAGNGEQVRQELCFYYHYDARGRMTVKHAPGAGEIRLVYDRRDRLVLAQDENQRNRPVQQPGKNKQWTFTLYDEYDRTIATGLMDHDASQSDMQTYVNGVAETKATVAAFTGATEQLAAFSPVVSGAGACNGCSNLVFNTIQYYDQDAFTGVLPMYTNYSFITGNAGYPQTSTRSFRINGMATGSKVRVIGAQHDDGNPGNDAFLVSTTLYDEAGAPFQSLLQNIKGGTDVSTAKFDFTGTVIAVHESHTMPGTSYTNFQTRSYRNFDRLGRATALYRQYGVGYNAAPVAMYQIQYDVFGRVSKKILSPAYNGGAGIEQMDYSYNLHGRLTGINKDYALSQDDYAQWDHYFGLYLGYDNRNGLFAEGQYNGTLAGLTWKTQGDNTPRKWDFSYDRAGRFTGAAFRQRSAPSDVNWSNGAVDCSVSNISYDANGNLKTMTRKGILPGGAAGIVVDNLSYSYKLINGQDITNKLDEVSDGGHGLGNLNGKLGDFADAHTGSTDYDYDANGNVTADRNRKVQQGGNKGIEWNYMDKPQQLQVEGKSTVSYVYDASGAKLGKMVTPLNGPVHTSWYVGDYLYEEDAAHAITLKYIQHEEGRIRILTPQNTFQTQVPGLELSGSLTMPDGKQGAMEWMLRDQQGNTRMVLTEEVHREYHECSMEDNNAARKDYEERMFGNIDNNGNIPADNEVVQTRVYRHGNWNSNSSDKASLIVGHEVYNRTAVVGPNMFLKIMAGDLVSGQANYFYESSYPGPGGNLPLLRPIVNVLVMNFNNGMVGGLVKDRASSISSSLRAGTSTFSAFCESRPPQTNGMPQAYLNWAFFDENFNFIPPDGLGNGSGYVAVSQGGDGAAPLVMPQIKAPKNGYVFVFLSNTTSSAPIFFDNFRVVHERGRILEENAYYPDGMKIAGLSAKAFDKLPNKFGYQGIFSEEEEESGYDEFALRLYDPTISRWLGVDPYDEFASPYIGMGNDPVNNVDPDGGTIWEEVGKLLLGIGTKGSSSGSGGQAIAGVPNSGTAGSSAGGGLWNAASSLVGKAAGKKAAGQLLASPEANARQLNSSTQAFVGAPPSLGPGVVLTGAAAAEGTNVAVTTGSVLGPTVLITTGIVLGSKYLIDHSNPINIPYTPELYQKLGDIQTLPGLPKLQPISPQLPPSLEKPSNDDDYITLYRGVGDGIDPKILYNLAKRGIAYPKGYLGKFKAHEDPEAHTMSDNYSIWTSWSTDEGTAMSFAKSNGNSKNGIILSKRFKKSDLVQSKISHLMAEGEFLVPGVVKGANVKYINF